MPGLPHFPAESPAGEACEPESEPGSSKGQDLGAPGGRGLSLGPGKRQLGAGDFGGLALCGGEGSSDAALCFRGGVFSSFGAPGSFLAMFSLEMAILCFLHNVSLSFLDSSLMSLWLCSVFSFLKNTLSSSSSELLGCAFSLGFFLLRLAAAKMEDTSSSLLY